MHNSKNIKGSTHNQLGYKIGFDVSSSKGGETSRVITNSRLKA